jgi:hypothetical protein
MLAELDVVVFLKSHEDLNRTAERVFGALGSQYRPGESEELGGSYFESSGLGFQASLFANAGEVLDPEFEDYPYSLEISSQFWCVELDTLDLEGPLSEYYARQLAFELNVETATEILLETTEDSEIFEIRSYRRNPQYRLDQAPTTPKVFVIETRQVEVPFEEEEYEEEEIEPVEGEYEEEGEEAVTEGEEQ